jgi:mannose-6-phosphate isomerase-like protein (cupin superfamily)
MSSIVEDARRRYGAMTNIADAALRTLGGDEGKTIWFLGTLMTVKATKESTSGSFGLIEQVAPPGFAPPFHVHHREDELFYLIEGQATFFRGDQTLLAGPGSSVFLPREVVHSFRIEGETPARLLQLTAPPGLEHFFVEMGEPAPEPILPPPSPPDLPRLLTLAPKYGFEIVGPPPE